MIFIHLSKEAQSTDWAALQYKRYKKFREGLVGKWNLYHFLH